MKYISLFSGIEAASVAWEGLGWEPVCFAELDEFPSAVLAYRYPEVPNVGDVTKVNWRRYKGKCDVVVGGSPCQSFSVAGEPDEIVRCEHCARAVDIDGLPPRCILFKRSFPDGFFCAFGVRR